MGTIRSESANEKVSVQWRPIEGQLGLQESYRDIFDHYTQVQDHLLEQLNNIFNTHIAFDPDRHLSFTDFIRDVCVDCDAANEAYKFYGKTIIRQINELGNYILQARKWIQKWETEGKNAFQYVTDQLDILKNFCQNIEKSFRFRYAYDFNEDAWKFWEDIETQIQSQPCSHEELREIPVSAYPTKSGTSQKTIEVFNELNLLDRLTYIKLYYDISSGKTDLVFPGGKNMGFPCEAQKTDVIIGALEPFFMGYLIDRDGPVNAVATFLEVKSAALLEAIRLESKKIKAMNAYLRFINRAFDVLNGSQSTATKDDQHRIPDGAMAALNYLCGGNMYNLFEQDGQEYLVLESNYTDGNCFLVKADESGMRFLIGDNGTDGGYRGNAYEYNYLLKGSVMTACVPGTQTPLESASKDAGRMVYYYYNGSGFIKDFLDGFQLPTPIPFEKIIPNSVQKYNSFASASAITADVAASWNQAFKDGVALIDTNIETVNTDIKHLRNKIDMLSSLSNIFRNRTYNAYSKITLNLKRI